MSRSRRGPSLLLALLATFLRRAALPAVALGVALVPHEALAQGNPPQVSASISDRLVEVGEPFTIDLKALSDQGASQARDPQLKAPPGFSVQGPQISTQTFMQFGGGASSVKIGIGAAWRLVASKPGRYSIPGPSVLWEGKRIQANAIVVEVVEAGKKPKHGSIFDPFGSNPFLTPGGPGRGLPWPFGDLSPDDEEEDPDSAELSLPNAPDKWIFVRVVPDKTRAVVGEQINVATYIYYRTDFKLEELRASPLTYFQRFPLLQNPGTEPVLTARAGDERYNVRTQDRLAAFPLRAGELHLGATTMTLLSRRIGGRVTRTSEDPIITVTEPPLAGRPPGYSLGDVGQFSLSATVAPRRIKQGDSTSIVLKVSGSGNLPQSLHVPERTGIEWLDPEKKEKIEARAGVVSGTRTFGFVVRVKESGSVKLGQVELPYWDPTAKRYEVARVDLGALEVEPTAPALDPATGKPTALEDQKLGDPFAALAGPRKALGAFVAPAAPPWDNGLLLGLFLAAPPLLVGLGFAGTSALSAMRKRRAQKKDSPGELSQRALAEAREAEARGDIKELAAALERALHHAIEGATGLKSRGVLLDDLPAELSERGLDEELADRAQALFQACNALRFDPDAETAARDLVTRASDLVAALAARRPA